MIQGSICSGKDYIGDKINQELFNGEGTILPVSHFVQYLSNMSSRQDLNKTQSLDKEIYEHMIEYISMIDRPLIFTGCRQLSIYMNVEQYCKDNNITFDYINIYVPFIIREKRWKNRNHEKDDLDKKKQLTFKEVDERDLESYELPQIVQYNEQFLKHSFVSVDNNCEIDALYMTSSDEFNILGSEIHNGI